MVEVDEPFTFLDTFENKSYGMEETRGLRGEALGGGTVADPIGKVVIVLTISGMEKFEEGRLNLAEHLSSENFPPA